MKSWLFQGMLAAAIALPALSGVARAGDTDDFGCSAATLKGEYAFGVTNYTIPQVVAGIKIFDGNGNFTFGVSEQSMFYEIDQDRIDRVRGMDINVVTSATTDDEGRALLRALGFPFKEN